MKCVCGLDVQSRFCYFLVGQMWQGIQLFCACFLISKTRTVMIPPPRGLCPDQTVNADCPLEEGRGSTAGLSIWRGRERTVDVRWGGGDQGAFLPLCSPQKQALVCSLERPRKAPQHSAQKEGCHQVSSPSSVRGGGHKDLLPFCCTKRSQSPLQLS